MARPTGDHDEVRRRVVASGRAIIAERGASALLLADVAEAVGLTAPSLYHYFTNRRSLVLAVLEAEIELLMAAWPSDREPDGSDRQLEEFLASQAAYLEGTAPNTLRFVLASILDPGDEEVAAVVAPAFGRAASVFRRYCERQLGRPIDVPADLMRSVLAGAFVLRALGETFEPGAVLRSLHRGLEAQH